MLDVLDRIWFEIESFFSSANYIQTFVNETGLRDERFCVLELHFGVVSFSVLRKEFRRDMVADISCFTGVIRFPQ